ncbi:M20/M25/M40 family metallo-hydrolase [Aerococcaceae bacterium 50-4]
MKIDALKDLIASQEGEMIAFLEDLVNTESGIEQISGINKVGTIIKQWCENLGMTTRTIPHNEAGDLLVAEYKTAENKYKKPIVLSGHMDTVFNAGVTKDHHFRLLADKPGFAKGAGLMDMKGGLVIAMYVVKNLIELGYDKHPLSLIFIPDEETLHRYSDTRQEMITELHDAELMLNFESSPTFDHIVVGRQGGMMMNMTVEGVQGHSGMEVEIGRSAVVELAHKVVALEALTDIPRKKLINCGMINGGVSANTIPGIAKGNFSLRFPNQAIKEEIIADIERIISEPYISGTVTKYEIESGVDAMVYTEKVDQLADHYARTSEKMGYGPLAKVQSQGASDASLASLVDIPVIDGIGIVGTGAHTLEEEADLRSLVPRVVLSIQAILDL